MLHSRHSPNFAGDVLARALSWKFSGLPCSFLGNLHPSLWWEHKNVDVPGFCPSFCLLSAKWAWRPHYCIARSLKQCSLCLHSKFQGFSWTKKRKKSALRVTSYLHCNSFSIENRLFSEHCLSTCCLLCFCFRISDWAVRHLFICIGQVSLCHGDWNLTHQHNGTRS